MSGKLKEVIFGPYENEEGHFFIGLVEYPGGEVYEEEFMYHSKEDCYEDIGDLVCGGELDLEDDELEEDVDYDG
jgi:hypothetical protein